MQSTLGPRGGYVDKAHDFLPLLFTFLLNHVPVDRICLHIILGSGFSDGCQQQFAFAGVRMWLLGPHDQFLVVVSRWSVQSGHDHCVEFQTLGFVNGHYLYRRDANNFFRVACACVQSVHAAFQRIEVNQLTAD